MREVLVGEVHGGWEEEERGWKVEVRGRKDASRAG